MRPCYPLLTMAFLQVHQRALSWTSVRGTPLASAPCMERVVVSGSGGGRINMPDKIANPAIYPTPTPTLAMGPQLLMSSKSICILIAPTHPLRLLLPPPLSGPRIRQAHPAIPHITLWLQLLMTTKASASTSLQRIRSICHYLHPTRPAFLTPTSPSSLPPPLLSPSPRSSTPHQLGCSSCPGPRNRAPQLKAWLRDT